MYQITLLYSPTDAAPQFLKKITPFIQFFHGQHSGLQFNISHTFPPHKEVNIVSPAWHVFYRN